MMKIRKIIFRERLYFPQKIRLRSNLWALQLVLLSYSASFCVYCTPSDQLIQNQARFPPFAHLAKGQTASPSEVQILITHSLFFTLGVVVITTVINKLGSILKKKCNSVFNLKMKGSSDTCYGRRWTLRTLCKVKSARYKRADTVWFHPIPVKYLE